MAIQETTIQYSRMATVEKVVRMHEDMNEPILLVSTPGIGKTALIKQVSKAKGRREIMLLSSQLNPSYGLEGVMYCPHRFHHTCD